VSAARAAQLPFLGGAVRREELRASAIRPEHAQGPVPAHLLLVPRAEDFKPVRAPVQVKAVQVSKPKPRRAAVVKKPRPLKPKVTQAKVRAERPNMWPCPACGSRSEGKGSAWGGGSWRKCAAEGCLLRFRTVTLESTKGVWPSCPHCQGATVANGKRSGKQILKCKDCGKTHRRVVGS
jgi:ribosomal protein L37AE/L43A